MLRKMRLCYLLRCRRILADINDAEFLLDARRAAPEGKLSITAR
ncbi:hypothetical protein [Neptunomonas sp.]